MAQISSLRLQDFRNYADSAWDFRENLVVFWGDNGQGKTNILEALSLLSTGRSWRTNTLNDFLRLGVVPPSALIDTQVGDESYRLQILPQQKILKRNESKRSFKQHLGTIPTLIFCPEHISLFRDSKRERQSFFDRWLVQLDPPYGEVLHTTKQIIRQKNALFQQSRNISYADLQSQVQIYNQQLQSLIPQVWASRQQHLQELNELLPQQWQALSGRDEDLGLELFTTIEDSTEAGVLDWFSRNQETEIRAGKCLLGPHRDDFILNLRQHPIQTTSSRGEQRSALLAILMAQKQVWKQTKQTNPILLLDDCFSELDDYRQQHLEKLCQDTQTFVTTTHAEHFAKFSGSLQSIEVGS